MTMRSRFGCCFISMLLAVLLVTLTTGCQTTTQNIAETTTVHDSQVLRVGVSTNAPPLIYRQNGKITGLEAALAVKLAGYLGKKVSFIEVPWNKQLEYLNGGKTDIVMSGMTITQQRSLLVDFATPYLRSGQIMLIRMEDSQRFSLGITSVMNTNYRIGTIADTVSDFFVTSTITKANEVVFSTSKQAVEALIGKEIDVLVYDAPMVCYYAAQHQADKLMPVLTMATEEYLGWAIRKSDSDLKSQVNTFLASLNGSGALQQEIRRWIPYLGR